MQAAVPLRVIPVHRAGGAVDNFFLRIGGICADRTSPVVEQEGGADIVARADDTVVSGRGLGRPPLAVCEAHAAARIHHVVRERGACHRPRFGRAGGVARRVGVDGILIRLVVARVIQRAVRIIREVRLMAVPRDAAQIIARGGRVGAVVCIRVQQRYAVAVLRVGNLRERAGGVVGEGHRRLRCGGAGRSARDRRQAAVCPDEVLAIAVHVVDADEPAGRVERLAAAVVVVHRIARRRARRIARDRQPVAVLAFVLPVAVEVIEIVFGAVRVAVHQPQRAADRALDHRFLHAQLPAESHVHRAEVRRLHARRRSEALSGLIGVVHMPHRHGQHAAVRRRIGIGIH